MAEAVDYQTPCAGPYACRLALKMAEDTVGPVCTKVVECLIDRGAQQVRCLAGPVRCFPLT